MQTLMSAAHALEAIALTLPSQQGIEGMGHVLDDVIDLMWDQSPGSLDRFLSAAQSFVSSVPMDAYAAR